MTEKPTPKILVVEDDRALLAALRDTLSTAGYQTLTATTGETALTLALKEKPDLIILDLMLKKLSGVAVLRQIRSTKGWCQEVKIIVLTGLTFITNMDEVKKLSTKFVAKSDFEMDSLITLIKQALA